MTFENAFRILNNVLEYWSSERALVQEIRNTSIHETRRNFLSIKNLFQWQAVHTNNVKLVNRRFLVVLLTF